MHAQKDIFDYSTFGLTKKIKKLEKSEEYFFYKTIFCNINEDNFAPIYCEDNGRPNSPINVLVCAMIIKEKNDWSYAQLFKQIEFNLLTRISLGLFSLDGMPFSYRTIFNFQRSLKIYAEQYGINLFEVVFNDLTAKQLAKLELKTNIARTDSFMVDSNIRSYGRLELLIEVILRFYRILSKKDKDKFLEKFAVYQKKGSQHYIYELKGSDISHEYVKITEAYYWLKTYISDNYSSTKEYEIFLRVYNEHFKIDNNNKIKIRDNKELGSGCLQSPDDPDATFRTKRKKKYHGQVTSITESSNPDNDINIIVDIVTAPNNIDDSILLNDRLSEISKKLPDLEQLHFDGGYGSEDNDKEMEEIGITPIQTAVRGRKAEVPMTIEVKENDEIEVTCPGQQKKVAKRTRIRYKVCFDLELCKDCKYKDKCPTRVLKDYRVFYFRDEDVRKTLRHNNKKYLPPDKQNNRANVEATINEFTHHAKGHKLKVRGAFKASIFAFIVGIAINFGRIYRYCGENDWKDSIIFFFHFLLV